jgi:hypothetical protein
VSDPMSELFGEPISVYTRAQAIDDGVLIDVSEVAAEAGIGVPVAMTAAAWAETVAWDAAAEARKPEGTGQDETGRLWDVVTVLNHAIRRKRPATVRDDPTRLGFEVLRVPAEGRGVRPRLATLIADAGPGDDLELVLTLLMPGED